jgi:hypothetical protein
MGRIHFGNISIYMRIILKWILQIHSFEGVDLIQLAQGRVQWWALVNMVMNFQVL